MTEFCDCEHQKSIGGRGGSLVLNIEKPLLYCDRLTGAVDRVESRLSFATPTVPIFSLAQPVAKNFRVIEFVTN